MHRLVKGSVQDGVRLLDRPLRGASFEQLGVGGLDDTGSQVAQGNVPK
jgi:hypothetical protein